MWQWWAELAANLFGAFGAAFAGAWVAFRLERSSRSDDDASMEVAGGNRALYSLYEIWNELRHFQIEVIEPRRGQADLWFNMDATPPFVGNYSIDARDVGFLLDEYANTYAKLMLEFRRFRTIIGIINLRSDIVLGEMHTRLSEYGIKVGDSRDIIEIEKLLGIKVVHHLKSYTKTIVEFVDDDVKSIPITFIEVRSVLKKRHPERKFLNVEFQ